MKTILHRTRIGQNYIVSTSFDQSNKVTTVLYHGIDKGRYAGIADVSGRTIPRGKNIKLEHDIHCAQALLKLEREELLDIPLAEQCKCLRGKERLSISREQAAINRELQGEFGDHTQLGYAYDMSQDKCEQFMDRVKIARKETKSDTIDPYALTVIARMINTYPL